MAWVWVRWSDRGGSARWSDGSGVHQVVRCVVACQVVRWVMACQAQGHSSQSLKSKMLNMEWQRSKFPGEPRGSNMGPIL